MGMELRRLCQVLLRKWYNKAVSFRTMVGFLLGRSSKQSQYMTDLPKRERQYQHLAKTTATAGCAVFVGVGTLVSAFKEGGPVRNPRV